MINVVAPFDGISCGQVALEKAGIQVGKYYAAEIEKHAVAITRHNYPDTIRLGNVYGIDYTNIKNIDLVMGGSPCTHWSIAKKDREVTSAGLGFELFMKFVEAVRILKPKYFLYENNYSIHKDIQSAITRELGVEPIFINSSLVSAQSRKRLYWTNIPVVGLPEDRHIYLKDIIQSGAVDRDKSLCIAARYHKGITLKDYDKSRRQVIFESPDKLGFINKDSQGQRIYSLHGKSTNLCSQGGGWGAKTGLYAISSRGRYLVNGKRVDETGAKTDQRMETTFSEKSNCLTTVQKDSLLLDLHNLVIRSLSCIEGERLQTLPDDYTKWGNYDGVVKEVAKTNRLRAIGNGWTADLIAWILKFTEV
jgi:DNA (cytosine-5)-methyltransferase 3A